MRDLFARPAASLHARGCSARCPACGSSLDASARRPVSPEIRGQVPSLARAHRQGCAFAAALSAWSTDLCRHRRAGLRRKTGRPRSQPAITRGRTPMGDSSEPRRLSAALPLLEVNVLTKHFPLKSALHRPLDGQVVHAVDAVTFSVDRAETLAVVGESGCGKVHRRTDDFAPGRSDSRRDLPRGRSHRSGDAGAGCVRCVVGSRSVFQDPLSAASICACALRDIIAEPIKQLRPGAKNRSELDDRVAELHGPRAAAARRGEAGARTSSAVASVNASASPGRSRRAPTCWCATRPSRRSTSRSRRRSSTFCRSIQSDLGLAMLFISHDLAIVEHMTHRVAVMYARQAGRDRRPPQPVRQPSHHPYTQRSAVRSAGAGPERGRPASRIVLRGDVPSPIDPPAGCRFHTRCPYVFDRCRTSKSRSCATSARSQTGGMPPRRIAGGCNDDDEQGGRATREWPSPKSMPPFSRMAVRRPRSRPDSMPGCCVTPSPSINRMRRPGRRSMTLRRRAIRRHGVDRRSPGTCGGDRADPPARAVTKRVDRASDMASLVCRMG